jgi:hypothetical protein
MSFNQMFKQPYLDADTGADLGGGGSQVDTSSQQNTDTQQLDTNQAGSQQQTQQEQMFKLKYNHEEREIPYSQAVELAQKGMNYDKAIERANQEAEQRAEKAFYSKIGYEWKGKPITCQAEYDNAIKERDLESEIAKKYAHLDEETQKEMIENRKFREQSQAEKKTIEAEKTRIQQETTSREQKQKESLAFLEEFKKDNGRDFDFNKDVIPEEVKKQAESGVPLDIAYIRYALEQKRIDTQVQQANEKNASTSTGSVKSSTTGNGALTEEMVASMSPSDLAKRWTEVRKLFKMQ